MINIELDQYRNLRHLYTKTRMKEGVLHSRLFLLRLQNAIERFLQNPPFKKGILIMKGTDIQSSDPNKVEQERKQRKHPAQVQTLSS